ncbi:hypothetical protein T484DRAFT_2842210 [Baffinella frigidus]|nr:hypothetical protein T484DRAFT_2842210 [Cryptophyta sp. CCMP2293]
MVTCRAAERRDLCKVAVFHLKITTQFTIDIYYVRIGSLVWLGVHPTPSPSPVIAKPHTPHPAPYTLHPKPYRKNPPKIPP